MFLFLRELYCKKTRFAKDIKKIIGFYPKNTHIFQQALTHKSYISKDGKRLNNERLEYLGDSILGFVIADYLYRKYTDRPEGFLTLTRSKLVNGKSLAHLCDNMQISNLIRSEFKNGIIPQKIKEDALEAFVGAVFLDSNLNHTRKFVLKEILKHIEFESLIENNYNYKSELIEWSQKYKYEVQFETTDIYGNKFKSEILINKDSFGTGIGHSKKEAEQNAAEDAMKNIKQFIQK